MPGGDMVVSSGGPWSRHVDGCSTQCQAQRLTVLGFFFPPPYSSVRVLPCSLVRRWAPQLGAGGRLRWSQHSAGAGAAGDAGTCLGRFCSGLGAAGAASSAKGQENFGQVPVGGGATSGVKLFPPMALISSGLGGGHGNAATAARWLGGSSGPSAALGLWGPPSAGGAPHSVQAVNDPTNRV